MWMLLIGLVSAEDNWTTEAVELFRWPGSTDDNPIVATVEADTKVEVLYVEGDRNRVRAGQDLGWTDAVLLTEEAPEGAGSLLEGLEIAPPPLPF